MLFPLTEVVGIVGEGGLGSKIRSLVWGILSLHYSLDIQVLLLSRHSQWCVVGEGKARVWIGEWIGGEKVETEM